MFNQLKSRASALKKEVHAITIAARDPRTPWYAQVLIFLIVAYALSPIDLIPDFVPILGYLDDLLIVPGGIWLAIRLIPPEVLEEARATASARALDRRLGWIGTVLILLIWVLAIIWLASLILHSWE
jgi:uncharacterized membrane protein YkvA (DUF1232 family)